MTKRALSLKTKIMMISVVPVVVLGVILTAFCTYTSYSSVHDEVYNTLRGMCVSIYEFVLSENGAESFISSDPAELDRISKFFLGIKGSTEIDVTFFKGDTRFITSVTDKDGNIVNGTRASDEVIEEVIQRGNEYFSDDIEVNGIRYFGYYMPVFGSDGNVAGMTFAGKNRMDVTKTISGALLNTLMISVAATLAAVAVSVSVSAKMVKALGLAIEFMNTVATGDTDCCPDDRLISRSDEIGVMGRTAVKLQQSLKKLISTDPLTGLLNRRTCDIRLEEIFKNGTDYTAAMGDIDLFKQFNDKHGHACGDEVLKFVSDAFRRSVGDLGFVSRWGGEEFLVILDRCGYEKALEIVNEISCYIRDNGIEYNGEKLKITITIGIQRNVDGMTPEEIINLADEKLYYGKNNGRNCIVDKLPENESP